MDLNSGESSLQPGATFAGRYVIERLIGLGGMGEVYLACDSLLENERVALKIIHADLSSEEKNIKRFQREIQLTRKIAHENIARTFDGGFAENRFYFSMEYLEGNMLSDLIKSGPMPTLEVCQIIQQVCAGLAVIHKAGVIHRDLKPGNLILSTGGQVKIMDFGIARPGNSNLTRSTEVLGSAPYMAPELWTGNELGASSDLYALGALFFELLTGVLPLDGETAAELMFKHLEVMPPPPSSITDGIPLAIDGIVLKLLSKAPSERFLSAEQVSQAIQSALESGRVMTTVEEYVRPDVLENDPLFSGSFPLMGEEHSTSDNPTHDTNENSQVSLERSKGKFFTILSGVLAPMVVAAILYFSIERILSPYLAEVFLIAQGPSLWYMRVLVTIGYLVTLGLFCSLPLLIVSSPLVKSGINPPLMLTTIARYSLLAGCVLTLNAVAFLALFKLDSQHSLGPYLLVILRQSVSGIAQIFLLIPPLSWENAAQMGGRIIVNAPTKIAAVVFIGLLPIATTVYCYYISRISGLVYRMHSQAITLMLAGLFALVVSAEMLMLNSFNLRATATHTLIHIGGMHLAYSNEQLFCAGLNWGFLFALVTLVSRVSHRN